MAGCLGTTLMTSAIGVGNWPIGIRESQVTMRQRETIEGPKADFGGERRSKGAGTNPIQLTYFFSTTYG